MRRPRPPRSGCSGSSRRSGSPIGPRRSAYLLDRWVEVADHELTTRETNEGYIRRTLKPALGDMTLRKLQHRVDMLDRLYTHLRRCNALCDGRPFIEHRLRKGAAPDAAHDCASAGCRPHVCRPMSPGAIRRLHADPVIRTRLCGLLGLDRAQPGPDTHTRPSSPGGGRCPRSRRWSPSCSTPACGRRRGVRPVPLAGGHDRRAARRARRASLVQTVDLERGGLLVDDRTTSSARGHAGSRARRPTTRAGCRSTR